MVPFTLPEREPVPVRRIPVPVRREAVPVGLGSIPGTAYTVSEIPYQCPRCGDRLALEDHHDLETLFVCPKHGVVGRFQGCRLVCVRLDLNLCEIQLGPSCGLVRDRKCWG